MPTKTLVNNFFNCVSKEGMSRAICSMIARGKVPVNNHWAGINLVSAVEPAVGGLGVRRVGSVFCGRVTCPCSGGRCKLTVVVVVRGGYLCFSSSDFCFIGSPDSGFGGRG